MIGVLLVMSKINKSIKCVFIRHPSQKFELNNHDMLSFGQGKAFGEVKENHMLHHIDSQGETI